MAASLPLQPEQPDAITEVNKLSAGLKPDHTDSTGLQLCTTLLQGAATPCSGLAACQACKACANAQPTHGARICANFASLTCCHDTAWRSSTMQQSHTQAWLQLHNICLLLHAMAVHMHHKRCALHNHIQKPTGRRTPFMKWNLKLSRCQSMRANAASHSKA